MPDQLILKHNRDATYTESYNVLFEGRHVGRIYKAISHAPREAPLLLSPSGLDLQALVALHRVCAHEDSGRKRKTATKAVFPKFDQEF